VKNQKKLKVFFGFSLRSQKKTKATNTQKPKKLEFFGFSQFFNHHFIQKKQKKH